MLVRLALLGISSLFALGALELAFRVAPTLLPPGAYGAGRWDAALRMNVHGGLVIYNKVRFVRRQPNPEGFMDVPHAAVARPGVVRIAFVGDSYVESLQVPLEQVFFRRLQEHLGDAFETFGFGVSGWGTFHAMRAWEVFGRRYDVDRVVYVFVGNDLGDQLQGVGSTGGRKPLLRPGPAGYEIVSSPDPTSASLAWRTAKWIQSRSRLAQIAHSRILAIRRGGVGPVREEQIEMSGRAGAIPGANDLPRTWPAAHSARARTLGAQVLRTFAERVRADGKEFFVLYTPRGEAQLRGEIAVEDTWLPWLRETCVALGIPLIDPTPELRARMAAGESVYSDHWDPAGHEAIAAALVRGGVGALR